MPAREFAEVENLPDWSDRAPRFAAVYDLFGNSKTALKYSLNRYNQARTTGIAATTTRCVDDVDAHLDRPERRRHRAGREQVVNGVRQRCVYRVRAARSTSPTCRPTSARALNIYGDYPRTWNLEHGLELQHELLPRLSVTGSWFHGKFHNLTTTINRPGKPTAIRATTRTTRRSRCTTR